MKAAVVGGGPAGCAAAYTLRKHGHEVQLFEAQDHVGGRTSQFKQDGFSMGTGALFLMGDIYPRTYSILKEIGHYRDLVPWKGLTHIVDADKQRYVINFDRIMSFMKLPIFSIGDKLHMVREIGKLFTSAGPASCFDGAELAKYDNSSENLEQWSLRVLGSKGHNYITVPYMGFLYAVPPAWLSTPLLHAIILQFYKMALAVPPGGIGQLSDWLVEATPNLDLQLSNAVQKIERKGKGFVIRSDKGSFDADSIVVAPEPGVSAEILKGIVPDSSLKKLKECRYSEYAHVQICYKKSPWPNFPVDIVLPANDIRPWGACVLGSRRQASSCPPGGEVVGVYFYTPCLASMSDEDIIQEALSAVTECFGHSAKPDLVKLFHYKRGLSIAGPGHYAMLNSLHAEMPRGITLAGDYFAHAGVEAAIFSGEQAANRLGAQGL